MPGSDDAYLIRRTYNPHKDQEKVDQTRANTPVLRGLFSQMIEPKLRSVKFRYEDGVVVELTRVRPPTRGEGTMNKRNPLKRGNEASPYVSHSQGSHPVGIQASDALEALVKARKDKDDAERRIDEAQALMIRMMKQRGVASIETNDGSFVGTIVEGSTILYDDDELGRVLTSPQWRSITKVVLDKKLLESAVASGDIDPSIVASCATEVPRNPYIKVTERKASAEGR